MASISITPQPPKNLELAPSEPPTAVSPPGQPNTPASSAPPATPNLLGAPPAETAVPATGPTTKVLDVPKRNISEVSSPNLVADGQSKRPRVSTETSVEGDALDAPVTMSPLALTADYGPAIAQEPPVLDLTAQVEPAQQDVPAQVTSSSAQASHTHQPSTEPSEHPPAGAENVEMEGTEAKGLEQNGVSAEPSAEPLNPQSGEDEEEEESEEWELGPDGLRLPSDVVEHLYAEREDGARRCQICMYVSILMRRFQIVSVCLQDAI